MDPNVFIFFVGLTVLSAGVPNDCGVKAILPRVIYTSPWQQVAAHRHEAVATLASAGGVPGRSIGPAVPFGDVQHVEDHQAVLVFRTTSLESAATWGAVAKLNDDYSYVLLDGDRVRFLTSDTAAASPSLAGIVLPRLGDLCPARLQQLRADYLPPYSGAAAVFDLPQGTISACQTAASAGTRVDTKLTLKTTTRLIVSASTMKTVKELRLKLVNGQVDLLVANVPKRFLKGVYSELPSTAMDGMSHVNVYYGMGATSGGSCALTLKQWYDDVKHKAAVDALPACNSTVLIGRVSGSPPPPLSIVDVFSTQAANFECSNTQWP